MKKGQALVAVLLVLGMALTVGLAVSSRSSNQVSISTTENESSQALEAAEVGAERALSGIITGDSTAALPSTDASYNVKTSNLGAGRVYEVPFQLSTGDIATINLEGYIPAVGSPSSYVFGLCWGNGTYPSGNTPAVEVILYYKSSSGAVRIARNGYDISGFGNFSTAVSNGNCREGLTAYTYSVEVPMLNTTPLGWAAIPQNVLGMEAGGLPLLMRIRALNANNLKVALVGISVDIPTQGQDVVSVGQSGSTAQKLHVVGVTPDLPWMFDAALFSGGAGGIVKS